MTDTGTEWQDTYRHIRNLVARHEEWRARCLNLCAAENAMSPAVRAMLDTDLAGRYGDYTGRDLAARRYFGTREIVEIEEMAAALAEEVFHAQYVELRPISGHVAGNSVIMGLCDPGDLVMELDRQSGGHRLAAKAAGSRLISLRVEFLPFDPVAFNIDVRETLRRVHESRPRLIIVGASNFLFPTPVRALAEGLRACPETVLCYDASHVLGLVAGGRFQDPLAEGAHLVLGGTQKSFPGPQGGLIYSNDETLMDTMGTTVHPALISNHHLNRLPALALALLEMKHWGAAYADQVIRNAKALGQALVQQGVPVVAADRGCTESHSVLLNVAGIGSASSLGRRLDENDIIVTAIRLPEQLGGDGLRIGVAEITRRGATEPMMGDIAEAIAAVLLARWPAERARTQVHAIAEQLSGYRFALDDGARRHT